MGRALMSFSTLLANSVPVDPVRSSLEGKEEFWFVCLLISSGVVAVGCLLELGETWSDLKEWWNLKKSKAVPPPSWHAPAAAIGLLLVILGVIGEGIFEGLVSMKETDLRAHDEQVLGDTIMKVGTAKDAAEAAQKAAERAENASSGAVVNSNNAIESASNAGDLAMVARTEADHFAQDIVSAKMQAANAVSQLASAEQRLADSTQREEVAEAKLSAIKTPRSLIHTDRLIAAISPYKGTEFTINSFMDTESSNFAIIVATALKAAGWVRKQPAGMNLGVPTLSMTFDRDREIVPSCIDTGVSLHVPAKESDYALFNSTAFQGLPKNVQAVVVLQQQLVAYTFPTDDQNTVHELLDPRLSEGTPVTICFGKKP
jgi:hypothetical protein